MIVRGFCRGCGCVNRGWLQKVSVVGAAYILWHSGALGTDEV